MEAFLKQTYEELQGRTRVPPPAPSDNLRTSHTAQHEYEALIDSLRHVRPPPVNTYHPDGATDDHDEGLFSSTVPNSCHLPTSYNPTRPAYTASLTSRSNASQSDQLDSYASPPAISSEETPVDDTPRKPKFGFGTFTLFRKKKRQLAKIEVPPSQPHIVTPADYVSLPTPDTPETAVRSHIVPLRKLSQSAHSSDDASDPVRPAPFPPRSSIRRGAETAGDYIARLRSERSEPSSLRAAARPDLPALGAQPRLSNDLLKLPRLESLTTQSQTPTPDTDSGEPRSLFSTSDNGVGSGELPPRRPTALASQRGDPDPEPAILPNREGAERSLYTLSRTPSSTYDSRMASRTSFVLKFNKHSQDICVGYEPACVAATTAAVRGKTTRGPKMTSKAARVGWLAIDMDHGREIVGKLGGSFLEALQCRFVSTLAPRTWAGELLDEITAPPVPRDRILDALKGGRVDSLVSDRAGLLVLSRAARRGTSTLLHSRPLVWWSAEMEDADSEEYFEVLIKTGRPRRLLKAASLRALVFRLASPHETDIEFMNDFLRGFRFLAHPVDVLRLLVVRYLHCAYAQHFVAERLRPSWSPAVPDSGTTDANPAVDSLAAAPPRATQAPALSHQQPIIQIRILNVIKRWFDNYLDDFRKFPELTRLLVLFLQHIRHDQRRATFVASMLAKLQAHADLDLGAFRSLEGPGGLPCGYPYTNNATPVASFAHLPVADTDSSYPESVPVSAAGSIRSISGSSITGSGGYKKLFFGGSKSRKRPDAKLLGSYRAGHGHSSASLRAGMESRPSYSVRDLDPKELFHQLTLIEHTMFRAISIDEFCHHGKSKNSDERQTFAPKLNDLIRWFNRMAIWVAKQILTTVELNDRIRLVQTFIHIAHQCLIWHNYNTCFEIVSALTLSSVKRLHRTWAGVSSKSQMMLNQLNTIMSQRPNYKMYRACLRGVWDTNGVGVEVTEDNSAPLSAARSQLDKVIDFQVESSGILHMGSSVALLPFIGVHLTDLLYSDEGNVSYIEPSRLNEPFPVALVNNTLISNSSIAHSNDWSSIHTVRRRESRLGNECVATPNSVETPRYDFRALALVSPAMLGPRHGGLPPGPHLALASRGRLGSAQGYSAGIPSPLPPLSAGGRAHESFAHLSPGLPLVVSDDPSAILLCSQIPLINCSKLRLMSTMLQKIQAAQQNLYPFKENLDLQSWLRSEVGHIFQSQLLPSSPYAFQALPPHLTAKLPVRIIPNVMSLGALQPDAQLHPNPSSPAHLTSSSSGASAYALPSLSREASSATSTTSSATLYNPLVGGIDANIASRLNGIKPGKSTDDFIRVSEDPEEWEAWLHKLSRRLEPPASVPKSS
ncbi:hypothetical protein IWQ60_006842 [Tieghemiomyces parasiticus]|uniref:Ras GEF n=1 Tax=Tieghemiomyces parasiticus TaxID=78921 RepID=A0A9W8DW51_9FUNG|nr:hypothetical protein IWQ60_006842 [Tieghemiomyces parasiticus]